MKHFIKPKKLPVLALGLGAAALVLQKLAYILAVDEKNLLILNHPLCIALGLTSLLALALTGLGVWKLDGSQRYEDNFTADPAAFAGHIGAAIGIGYTALRCLPAGPGYLGQAWLYLGWLSPVCLLLAGYARLRGNKPFFLLHMAPTLFYVLHLINHYQSWCADPQLPNYIFALLGTMAMALFGLNQTCFDVELGNRRMLLAWGLCAVFLCMAELAVSSYPILYLGSILWAVTGLCALEPKPKAVEEKEE